MDIPWSCASIQSGNSGGLKSGTRGSCWRRADMSRRDRKRCRLDTDPRTTLPSNRADRSSVVGILSKCRQIWWYSRLHLPTRRTDISTHKPPLKPKANFPFSLFCFLLSPLSFQCLALGFQLHAHNDALLAPTNSTTPTQPWERRIAIETPKTFRIISTA